MLASWAAAATWIAVVLDDDLDPHHAGIITAGVFAAGFCFWAFTSLASAANRQGSWLKAGFSLAIAVLALIVLDTIAFASRLGG
jgi:hypothetical protein